MPEWHILGVAALNPINFKSSNLWLDNISLPYGRENVVLMMW